MAVGTGRSFDLEAFRRGYETWDVDALLALYADEVELIQLDRENAVAGEHRAAATVTCEFPGGRKVVANGIFEFENGRIVRERQVLSGDPK